MLESGSQEERQLIAAALEAGMDGEARHVSTCNKVVYQDYTAVAHYLTQEQWRFFLKETECDENKAMRIGEVMSLLGCQVAGPL